MGYEKIKIETDERIISVVRRHWFIIVSELLVVFLALILPLTVFFLLSIIPTDLLPAQLDTHAILPVGIYAIALWSFLSIISGFSIWTNYFLDYWIITDRRVIVVNQVYFFKREVSSFQLERLQDIKFSVNGFLATVLNFGTVYAQTAGMAESRFQEKGVPNPQDVQTMIQKAVNQRIEKLHSHPNF